MSVIYLKTKSYVCLKSQESTDVNIIYNISTDELGLPYISIYSILNDLIEMPKNISINLAQVQNYVGVRNGVNAIIGNAGISPKIIQQQFTDYIETKDGFGGRVLKPGFVFEARIELPTEERKDFDKALTNITHIGYTNDIIQGEVEIYVDWDKNLSEKEKERDIVISNKDYVELEYEIETISPICLYTPYNYREKSKQYITGEAICDALSKCYREEMTEILKDDDLIFSNAYPQSHGKRGIPIPICMSVVKLEKSKLFYRLAPVPRDFESIQTVKLNGYILNPGEHTIRYFKGNNMNIYPVTIEKNNLCDSKRRDAISSGIMFKGFIRGKSNTIKQLAKMISDIGSSMKIGVYQKEGFGEITMSICNLIEKKNTYEMLVREFDVYCASPVIMYDEYGMSCYNGPYLLKEIEKKLGIENKLEIVTAYTDIELYVRIGDDFKEKDSFIKCMKQGSSIRVKTKNNEPIDISSLSNAFVGDYNLYGFGEIVIVPAYREYYGNASEIPVDKYHLSKPKTITEFQASANIIKGVTHSLLDTRISLISFNDRGENAENIEPPMFILKNLRDQYDKMITNEELVRMYKRYL